MKKKIIGIFIFMMVITTAFFFPVTADEDMNLIDESELHVGVFGASMLSGLRRAGFVIANYGDEIINDIQWTFTIESILDDSIDLTYSDEIESMAYNEGYQFTTPEANGVGLVELTIAASSSNAGEVTETVTGFQIGPYTLYKTVLSAWN